MNSAKSNRSCVLNSKDERISLSTENLTAIDNQLIIQVIFKEKKYQKSSISIFIFVMICSCFYLSHVIVNCFGLGLFNTNNECYGRFFFSIMTFL